MTPFINGFTDELVKLGAKNIDPVLEEARVRGKTMGDAEHMIDRIVSESSKKKRNYLTSALVGAGMIPATGMASKAISRVVKNISRAKGAPARKLFSKKDPLMSGADLAGESGKGALMGSAYQAAKDKFDYNRKQKR